MTVGYWTYDNILPDEQRRDVNNFLHQGGEAGWKFGWKSSDKTDSFSFWHRHFGGYRPGDGKPYDCEPEIEPFPVIYALWRKISATGGPVQSHRLIRCYANGHTYGSDGTTHTDSKLPGTYTCVYYPHQNWNPDWGGDTVIFNQEKTDIIGCVYPRANRMLIFDGSIPHVARGVSRTCPVLRVTLMFKTDMWPDAG